MTDQTPPYWAAEIAEHEADMSMPYQPPARTCTDGGHWVASGHTNCSSCGADMSPLDDEDDDRG